VSLGRSMITTSKISSNREEWINYSFVVTPTSPTASRFVRGSTRRHFGRTNIETCLLLSFLDFVMIFGWKRKSQIHCSFHIPWRRRKIEHSLIISKVMQIWKGVTLRRGPFEILQGVNDYLEIGWCVFCVREQIEL